MEKVKRILSTCPELYGVHEIEAEHLRPIHYEFLLWIFIGQHTASIPWTPYTVMPRSSGPLEQAPTLEARKLNKCPGA